MSVFYTRTETEKEITIIFRSLAVRMYLVCILFILLFSIWADSTPGLSPSIVFAPFVFFAFFLVIIVFTVAYWKPQREIRAALKKGEVRVSGGRWSFSNPRTVVIPK